MPWRKFITVDSNRLAVDYNYCLHAPLELAYFDRNIFYNFNASAGDKG